MTTVARTNSSPISTGADHILRNNIGLAGPHLEKARETINAYSKPQQWKDSSGWLKYIGNNIDHMVRRFFNTITLNCFNIKSNWTRLSERTVEQFKAAAAADPELSAPYVQMNHRFNVYIDKGSLFGISRKMTASEATDAVIQVRTNLYANRLLALSLTAQTKQLFPSELDRRPGNELTLTRFVNMTRGDRRILTALAQNESGIRNLTIDPGR